MKVQDVINALRSYMGTDDPLIQVGGKLYQVNNVSFNNISGRPILVAGDEVTITPPKEKGSMISPSDLEFGDMIEGQYGIYTVIAVYQNEVQLVRPIVVPRSCGYYNTEYQHIAYILPDTQKKVIYAGCAKNS